MIQIQEAKSAKIPWTHFLLKLYCRIIWIEINETPTVDYKLERIVIIKTQVNNKYILETNEKLIIHHETSDNPIIRHFTTLLLDFITAWFILSSLLLLFATNYSFRYAKYTLDMKLLYGLLALIAAVCLLQYLRRYVNSSLFTLLSGLSLSWYLLLTLSQNPPVSYCIGLFFISVIMIYLCLPSYKSIWQKQKKFIRSLIVAQILLLFSMYITMIYIVSKNLHGLKTDLAYTNIFSKVVDITVILAIATVAFIILYYIKKRFRIPHGSPVIIIIIVVLLNLCLLGLALYTRATALFTPTYDMGIFSQMFHYMNTIGLPLTTLERNGLLSHFSVHLSPIYYLMLPFYKIWPHPETLQILQVLVVQSGVIPLFLLCRHFKIKKTYLAVLVTLYLFHPGIVGSSLFDLHENCFLAPLILWLFYFTEKKAWAGIIITTLLIFAVKEDAAFYVVVIGLFMLFSEKRRKMGAILMAMGIAYFLIAVKILSIIGEGAMFWRYENLVFDASWGISGIIFTLLTNPGYFLNELFAPGKLLFLLTVLASLGFLPVLQRKFSNLILLIPILVINLMPSFGYQYELFYQYHYATTIFMLYIIILFLSKTEFAVLPKKEFEFNINSVDNTVIIIKPLTLSKKLKAIIGSPKHWVNIALCLAILCSFVFTFELFTNRYVSVIYLKQNHHIVNNIKAELDKIPQDASIQASTFLTTYLSNRDVVYDLLENQNAEVPYVTDYVIIDRRPGVSEITQADIDKFNSYNIVTNIPDRILILQKP